MSDISNLKGCGTALVTPFKEDLSVDEHALRRFVDFQITDGIDFSPCGGKLMILTLRSIATGPIATGRIAIDEGLRHSGMMPGLPRHVSPGQIEEGQHLRGGQATDERDHRGTFKSTSQN